MSNNNRMIEALRSISWNIHRNTRVRVLEDLYGQGLISSDTYEDGLRSLADEYRIEGVNENG